MKCISTLKSTVFALTLGLIAQSAQAQWQLDGENSRVEFLSTKNAAVTERHSFTGLAGDVSTGGDISVTIELDSVETLIPIRNERMREMLFETVDFPAARVAAKVDPSVLKSAAEGAVVVSSVPVTLSLHGHEQGFEVPVVLAGLAGGGVMAVTSSPILLNAADFDLIAGINALREVAGLDSIVTVVPVTFQLLFYPAS